MYQNKILWYPLTLSWWRSPSYRNQSIDLLWKSVDWFLYDRILRHERVKPGLALHVASFNLKKHPNTPDNTLNLLVRSCILWLCFCLSKVPKSDITVLTCSKNLQKSWYCKQVQSSWHDIYLSSDGWHHSETGQVLFKRRQMQTIFRSRYRFR